MKHPVHNYSKHYRHITATMVSPPFHPGGMPACSRWLSEAIPPESPPAASGTPAGVPAPTLLPGNPSPAPSLNRPVSCPFMGKNPRNNTFIILKSQICKLKSHPQPARATGGGRSRAATPFACGAGTLWRGFAGGLRMTLLPSKQPSFPHASLN